MKVTIKTISGPSFEVDADAADSVADLKDKVVASAPGGAAFNKESLLLIHKGKVLNDGQSLGESGVEEGSFCVAMQRKTPQKPPAESSTTQVSPLSVHSNAANDVIKGVLPSQPESSVPPQPTEEPASQESEQQSERGGYEQAASTLATGSQLEENINQICEMGFERNQVIRAMHAAFNNPDRAVEYLMNGIPQVQAAESEQTPATGTAQAVGGTPVGSQEAQDGGGPNAQPLNMFGGSTGGEGGSTLDFLRNNPQFQQFRQIVAQNPQVLQPMLQELGRMNPEVLRLINENQQEFLSLLTEEAGATAQVNEAAEGLMQLAGQPNEATTITITPEDAAAIERLESLGFDRDRCVEAFFICDKNEEIAANYLLEHADDS